MSSSSTSKPCSWAALSARRAISTGCWPGTIGRVATSAWRPSTASCSCAAGRATSSEAIRTFLRSFSVSRLASLAVVVVLPEPCRPTIMITAGGVGGEVEPRFLRAQHLDQSVMDDLDDLLARRDRAQHLLADRLLGRLVDELADHREATSASSSAMRTSRIAARTSASVSAPRPRRRSNTPQRRSPRLSNMLAPTSPLPAPKQNRRRAKSRRPACVRDASALTPLSGCGAA